MLQADPANFVEVSINIVGAIGAPLPALTFQYLPAPFEVVNTGHGVQVNVPAGRAGRTTWVRRDG